MFAEKLNYPSLIDSSTKPFYLLLGTSDNFKADIERNEEAFNSLSQLVSDKTHHKIIIKSNSDLLDLTQYHFSFAQEDEINFSNTQFQQEASLESFIANSRKFMSVYEQLIQAKQSLGLNILELALILQVSRPTVYGWIETNEIKLRKKNQERLNILYEIGKFWKTKQLGHLCNYLHKPLDKTNASLFTLLKSDRLNLDKIYHGLDIISQFIMTKHKKDKAHEALLKKHGFEPISKEDMEDRLNDIDFLD